MYRYLDCVPLNMIFLLVVATILTVSSGACAQSSSGTSDAIFEAMQIEEGSWAADIGSGDGDYSIPMASIVGDSGHIFAVDIDEGKLQELRKRLKVREVTGVSPIYSISGDPMLPPNSLDAVRNAYHEFRNYMSMLQHIHQSLKPGGRLVMVEPIQEEMIDKSREEQAEEHDIAMRYALDDLKEAGFRIIKEVDHFNSNRYQRYWMIIAEKSK